MSKYPLHLKSYGQEMKRPVVPEFTAHEVNKLSELARKSAYYQKCKTFVDDFLNDRIEEYTERQPKWPWGIKKELREILEE